MSNHESYRDLSLEDLIEEWRGANADAASELIVELPSDRRIALVKALSHTDHERIIESLTDDSIRLLLAEMAPDDLVDLMQNTSAEVRLSVWQNLGEETKRETLFLLRFDEDDAAGIMTPRFLAIQRDATVERAVRFIRTRAEGVETIYYLYVVDALQRLSGVVSLRNLLTSPDDVRVAQIMNEDVIEVEEDTDQEEVAKILETHDFLALPVVDTNRRLVRSPHSSSRGSVSIRR